MFLVTPTPAQIAAGQIRQIARQQFVQLAAAGLRGFKLIWQNPNATPQQVLAELGTDAAAIFALAKLNIETLTAAAQIGGAPSPQMPSVPEGFSTAVNPDGSVKLTSE